MDQNDALTYNATGRGWHSESMVMNSENELNNNGTNENGEKIIYDGVNYIREQISDPGVYGITLVNYRGMSPSIHSIPVMKRVNVEHVALDEASLPATLKYFQENKAKFGEEFDVSYDLHTSRLGFSIRILKKSRVSHTQLLRTSNVTEEVYGFIDQAYKAGVNIMISGATGVGKTTFLNTLMDSSKDYQRTVFITSVDEMSFGNDHKEIVEIHGENSSNLIIAALRMAPYRVVIDENYPDEYLMMNAASCGTQLVQVMHFTPVANATEKDSDELNSRLANNPYELRVDVERKKVITAENPDGEFVFSVVAVHQLLDENGQKKMRTLYSGAEHVADPSRHLRRKIQSGLEHAEKTGSSYDGRESTIDPFVSITAKSKDRLLEHRDAVEEYLRENGTPEIQQRFRMIDTVIRMF